MTAHREPPVEAPTEKQIGLSAPFPESPLVVAAQNDETIEDELDAMLGILTPQQLIILRRLQGLFRSLAGPQDLLDAAGGLNRPPFPVPPRHLQTQNGRSPQRRPR